MNTGVSRWLAHTRLKRRKAKRLLGAATACLFAGGRCTMEVLRARGIYLRRHYDVATVL